MAKPSSSKEIILGFWETKTDRRSAAVKSPRQFAAHDYLIKFREIAFSITLLLFLVGSLCPAEQSLCYTLSTVISAELFIHCELLGLTWSTWTQKVPKKEREMISSLGCWNKKNQCTCQNSNTDSSQVVSKPHYHRKNCVYVTNF